MLVAVAKDLQDATSITCFVFLCNQISVLFCTLSIFALTSREDLDIPMITNYVLIISLIPSTMIGIILCARRISKQYQKIKNALLMLEDILITQVNCNPRNLQLLNGMLSKSCSVLTAADCVELTQVIFGLLGSSLAYGLKYK
ncbi:hypothetical protein AVEN_178157-1 [Araneus ventricosus]|uniref:Uncharacterized protein n=1 Tax=Araneus ventricosus TaxID=182803 RepID=A0A4Y2LKD7_ARAVE|nr:hypothetical protein AVEN_178157-1 [Araneus ventricosus]